MWQDVLFEYKRKLDNNSFQCSAFIVSVEGDDVHSPFMNNKSSFLIPPHPLYPLASAGCSTLYLDYFGPEEESRSSSNSPPPGVDPELYELTISKLETSANRCHLEDTLNCLMSAAVKTSTSVRNPQQDEELTMEASRVVTGLPNLSFMMAKVLMFPSILLPRECSAE
uniref:aftiphilin-like n=1 Tax=Monopterus albus TaxID=43700 RepID=UPI0009B30E90|nr:aftiphilin-like [Monopterus albus]